MWELRNEEQAAASHDIQRPIVNEIAQALPRSTVMNTMRQCPQGTHCECVLLTYLGKAFGSHCGHKISLVQ